ncbi:hypothetical protein VE04_06791 [Pseudogymnoascus sp. 24MN13]|nr:hypothetical protein VE04_06791 [Pseudogymnoascus sp. 24MN13]
MADQNPLADSGITIRSDSEQYSNSGPDDLSISPSPPSTPSSPLILYSPPTFWSSARCAASTSFRLGWGGTKVFPSSRNARAIGPGIEIRDSPEEIQRERDMDRLTSLE